MRLKVFEAELVVLSGGINGSPGICPDIRTGFNLKGSSGLQLSNFI
jgi:hypothetical protein